MLLEHLLPVFALAATAIAGSVPFLSSFTKEVSTKTEIKCSTYYGSKTVKPVPTSSSTKTKTYLPWFGTSVYTPIVTITPVPITQTSTVEETVTATITDNAVTDVFSTTLTEYTTETSVVLSTSITTKVEYFTATETAPDSTYIVPTSTGFLPIESTVPTQYPNTPSKRFNQPRGESKKNHGDKDICKDKFPKSVTCTKWVEEFPTIIYVKTAKASTITLPPATSTSLSTLRVTSTSTVVPPNVSITSSFTSTATSSTVSTDIVISTATTSTTSTLTMTHTTSLYAACTPGSKNLLGPNTPQGYILGISDSNDFLITRPGDAYNCCVECQNNPKCMGTFYDVGPDSPGDDVGRCLQVQNNQCNLQPGHASQSGFTRAYFTITNFFGWGVVASNGNCGFFYWGGPF